jgi:isoquinoline 1-oxidoreductase subunit beta
MEKFELSDIRISRRALLVGTAVSALGIAFGVRAGAATTNAGPGHQGAVSPKDDLGVTMSAWVVIRPDNTVVVKVPQAELGQGTLTTIAQMLGEELEVRWQDIRTEFYQPRDNITQKNVYVWTATLSSNGVALLYVPTRVAGAQIRTMLISAAADVWGVPVERLVAKDGCVLDTKAGQSLSYARLAALAAKKPIPDPKQLKLKNPGDWTFIGKSIPRVDIPSKVDGSARFGIDVQLPGMKYAAVRQSPVFGGRLKSYDAKAIPGSQAFIKVVKVSAGKSGLNEVEEGWGIDYGMDDAVAVVADDWWTANRVLRGLPIEWEEGKFAKTSIATISRDLLHALEHPPVALKPVRIEGDAIGALKKADKVLEAKYWAPFTEHAPMEPLNCTALVTADSVEVWVGTQFADEALRIACHYAGLPVSKGRLNLMLCGGGFGRRINSDFVGQAVQIAKTMPGVPVKLLWSREECFRRGYNPPLTVTRFKGGLDSKGNITSWISSSAGGRAPDQTYGTCRMVQTFPNTRIDYQQIETPPPFGWKRGVAFTQQTWMNMSFIDELAHAAGKDPYDVQLALLNPENVPKNFEKRDLQVSRVVKQRKVLRAVAEIADWHRPVPAGHGKGIAVHDMSYTPEDQPTAGAAIAEVQIDESGNVAVKKLTIALDCGPVINPDNALAQIQGGAAYAISDVLFAELTITDGHVDQSNFNDYPVLRLAQMPTIDVHFLKSDTDPQGIGETAVPLTMAAVVNAIHAAGGPRIRQLPIKHANLRAA